MIRTVAIAGMLMVAAGLPGFAVGGDVATTESERAALNAQMFERLKTLVGEWQGTYEWTGGRTGSGPLRVTYTLTGAGSALVENLWQGGDIPSMSSVYHLDGADLRMTHFCGARNQPRLKADRVSDSPQQVEFSFVDVTGVTKNGHVRGASVKIVDEDHIVITFVFGGGPPQLSGTESIKVERVKQVAKVD